MPEQDNDQRGSSPADPWAAPDPGGRPTGDDRPRQEWAPAQPPSAQPQPNAGQPQPWGAPPPWSGQPQPWGAQPPWTGQPQPWAGHPQPWAGQPQQWAGQPQHWGGHPHQWGGPPQQPWGATPWGWAPPPPDPKAQRRKRRLAIGSITAVVLLLVGTLVGVKVVEDRREARIRADVAALLPGLQDFVEQQRGLPFREPVEVEVLDDDAFLDALYETPEGTPEPPEDIDPEPTLKALGLLDPDADLDEQVSDSLDAGVVGFYDPVTDRLVVRGKAVDAMTELVIVHELVHALQDQHFDIDRPELDQADDERSTAFTALVEGDASVVELAWYDEQSPARQREIDRGLGSSAGGEPGIVEALLGFPYYAGPAYVEALLAQGGRPALDAAYSDPPATTEQILRPSEPEGVAQVPAPQPAGEVLDRGVLGLLGLQLVTGLDPVASEPLPGGWNGDRYVTYEDGDRSCTLAHVAADDAASLRSALADWAAGQPEAEVTDGPAGTVRLLACA